MQIVQDRKTLKRIATPEERKFWEAIHLAFSKWGVFDREKAQDLWEYGFDRGWISRKGSYMSIQESIDRLCRKAQLEGILWKFQ